ncbi:MAG: hypothetical protein MUP97_12880 [Acidimicrobiia bacterium]|nr:hypothetical protein [Acidimicrobiia bacterium]
MRPPRRSSRATAAIATSALALLAFACQPATTTPTTSAPTTTAPATCEATNTVAPTTPAADSGFIAFGDAGTCDATQQQVADQMRAWVSAGHRVDALVEAGDDVYPDGSPSLFAGALDTPYAGLRGPTRPLWVALGNHDVQAGHGAEQLAYLKLPALPYTKTLAGVQLLFLDANHPDIAGDGDPTPLRRNRDQRLDPDPHHSGADRRGARHRRHHALKGCPIFPERRVTCASIAGARGLRRRGPLRARAARA